MVGGAASCDIDDEERVAVHVRPEAGAVVHVARGVVHQALWSNSTLMSCLQYNALYSEIMSAEAENAGRGVASPLSALSLTQLKPLGFRKLNERYGEAAPKRKRG